MFGFGKARRNRLYWDAVKLEGDADRFRKAAAEEEGRANPSQAVE